MSEEAILETTTVRVAEGELRGCRVESRAGGSMWKFLGIPYARPPVGSLRFKDAQPAEPWSGVRDALKEGSNCTQNDHFMGQISGSEDCLYLNVYMPRAPSANSKPLPVMVYIHGGGFVMGSGTYEMCGPDYLLAEDVIFVSLNYRLGVLGFLYLEEASPGNAGLKDQVAALRWVHKNIAAFGGDPNNVTIFGISAGGASVHMHMLSPMSKGLFQRAVAMSGAAVNPWAQQTQPQETTRRLARLLGCTSDDPASIVDFLRTVDHKELVRVSVGDAVPDQDKEKFLSFSFVPTPETVVPGVETFLTAPLEQLIEEGRHHDVPFMTGVTAMEGLIAWFFNNFEDEEFLRQSDAKWEQKILPSLRRPPSGYDKAAAVDALRKFFLDGKPLTKETAVPFTHMLSDILFGEGVHYSINNMAKKSKSPLYQYLFNVKDQLNFAGIFTQKDLPGVSHGDDMGYVFHTMFSVEVSPDSTAAIARKRFVRLLTNYAKTGDPTPEDDPLLGARWTPFSLQQRHFLEIGSSLRPATALHARRVAFWEDFYRSFGGAAHPAPSPRL